MQHLLLFNAISITWDFQCNIQFEVNCYYMSRFVVFTFQAKLPEESFPGSPDKIIHNQNVNIPPATHLIADLEPHSLYAVRVACHSSQGSSDWSPWVEFRTKQGGEAAKCGDVCACVECEVASFWRGLSYQRPTRAPSLNRVLCTSLAI